MKDLLPRSSPRSAAALLPALLAGVALLLGGCIRHQVDPVHITVDVNLKVDRQLDQFFDFEKSAAQPPAPKPQ